MVVSLGNTTVRNGSPHLGIERVGGRMMTSKAAYNIPNLMHNESRFKGQVQASNTLDDWFKRGGLAVSYYKQLH